MRTTLPATATTAKELVEDVTKATATEVEVDILAVKVKAFKWITPGTTATASRATYTRMTKLVIALTLLGVL